MTGWLGAALVAAAGLVPLGYRMVAHRRAAVGSRPVTRHVALGLAAAAAALLHTFAVIPALGSPAAIRGGMLALAPGAGAFFLLVGHVGVGLRLRDPKLRKRPQVRRTHVALAITIVVAVAAHVVGLRLA